MKKGVKTLTKIATASLVAGVAMVVVYLSKLTVSADTLTSAETFGMFQYVFIAAIVLIALAAVFFVVAVLLSN